MSIDFLTIGHISHDVTPDGFRLGGTVSFASVTARRLGRRPAILTRGTAEAIVAGARPGWSGRLVPGPDSILDGVDICLLPAPVSTTFSNVYRDGSRTQVIAACAAPLYPDELPATWSRVPIVLLGPVAREVPPAWTGRFANALIGITPQGWMRRWDETGHVSPARWENVGEFVGQVDVVVLSREDAGNDQAYLASLARHFELLVVTDGRHGATVYREGRPWQIPPRPVVEVDPTGAGDVFAAAFMIRLAETGDPLVSARFANVVASMSVEAIGIAAIPHRAEVEAYLRQNP